jgi:serine/threonine protein kinase
MDPNKHQNALNLNDRLHWYEIKSILGQGGFGITYIAHDTNLDHDVAIKEYLPVECSTRNLSGEVQPVSEDCSEIFEWGKARFLEEARTLFQFKHKNIVRVLSFFEANNTGYMVMEYVQGMDFSDLIALGEPFSESELLGIIIPILDGLELVHDQGFIHRDIKPQNIVLHSDGHPVLIDFGSARQAMGAQTRTLTTLISPGYSPLEQYHQDVGEQGPWTDIYALGATLYAGVTGKKPADALQRSAARSGKEPDTYRRLMDIKPGDYSDHFLAAIDHALEFAAKNRPQSLNEWSNMLQGIEPVPNMDPIANINPGLEINDKFAQPHTPPSTLQSVAAPENENRKHNRFLNTLLIVLVIFGSLAYFQWDTMQPLLSVYIDSKRPVDKVEIKVATDLAHGEITEKPVAEQLSVSIETNEQIHQVSEVKQSSLSLSVPQPKPGITVNLSGSYFSEVTYTRNDFGVDYHSYFGESPNLQVTLRQVGNEITGSIEGSRTGRIKGTLNGNEINFAFDLIDTAGSTNKGKGTWFVARDGEKFIGRWSSVNASDGSAFFEGDWKLTRL